MMMALRTLRGKKREAQEDEFVNIACYDKSPDTFAGLKQSGDFSDLKIKCGDEVFNVHKAIICPQSEFFMKACKGAWKESNSNTIELKGDDPDTVERMIDSFYKGKYGPSELVDKGKLGEEVLMHLSMFAIADKYLAADLRGMAFLCTASCIPHLPSWLHALPDFIHMLYKEIPAPVGKKLREKLIIAVLKNDIEKDLDAIRLKEDVPEFLIDLLTERLKQKDRGIDRLEERIKRLIVEKNNLQKENESLKAGGDTTLVD